ncbi:HipA domain-containing protein [Aquiflexum sp. LQ15W]|uniref:HipA domain-containing protein n=1 Tax=Cognataquiflexum nitidum TaxID=2922272 RepID=UPI001F13DB70|nr:HipA domain-containing protein [Cognataquiflexum nitidum]MCH6202147.1 HipA domain-containing protein [Cognataquiflexum nitidum]
MNLQDLKYCPCTLAEGFDTYSPAGLRLLFNRKKVSHILEFNAPRLDEEVAEKMRQNSKSISISGAQFKQSLVLDQLKLRLTEPRERGQFILKPIPIRPPFAKEDELPANEHLTMQIAKQVFGIRTAECALVFFQNGEPAYITKRFDYYKDGSKIAQEDFASISGRSKEKDGESYRNSGSYETIAKSMKKYVAAYAVEIEKYFEQVVFNYLFCNGDAHLKNFSLQQTPSGDYVLSPAYDLINTSLHISFDSFFALEDGLFDDDYETESFKALGFYAYDDFYEFGIKIGMRANRVQTALEKYRKPNDQIFTFIQNSFLTQPAKDQYFSLYSDRLKMLNNSFSGLV